MNASATPLGTPAGDSCELAHRLLLARAASAALHRSAVLVRLQAVAAWLESVEVTASLPPAAGGGTRDTAALEARVSEALRREVALCCPPPSRERRGGLPRSG